MWSTPFFSPSYARRYSKSGACERSSHQFLWVSIWFFSLRFVLLTNACVDSVRVGSRFPFSLRKRKNGGYSPFTPALSGPPLGVAAATSTSGSPGSQSAESSPRTVLGRPPSQSATPARVNRHIRFSSQGWAAGLVGPFFPLYFLFPLICGIFNTTYLFFAFVSPSLELKLFALPPVTQLFILYAHEFVTVQTGVLHLCCSCGWICPILSICISFCW